MYEERSRGEEKRRGEKEESKRISRAEMEREGRKRRI